MKLRTAEEIIEQAASTPLVFDGFSKTPMHGDRKSRIAGSTLSYSVNRHVDFDFDLHDVKQIDWQATERETRPGEDERLIAALYDEPLEVPVRIIVNVQDLSLRQVRFAALIAASLLTSAAETHDPAQPLIVDDCKLYDHGISGLQPMRQIRDAAVEMILTTGGAQQPRDRLTYAGLNAAIQSIDARRPSMVFIIMGLQRLAPERHRSRLVHPAAHADEATARDHIWQVIESARDVHDVRCALVIDDIQRELPFTWLPALHNFDGGWILNWPPRRRSWRQRFAQTMAAQASDLNRAGVPYYICNTGDGEDQHYELVYNLAEGV